MHCENDNTTIRVEKKGGIANSEIKEENTIVKIHLMHKP
jgi:hypothetical protein